ncbi:Gfo/Idh/MocA family oxidoreductase [Pontibacter sp. E15-1]|uniref:Gfo/Idh/MocA family protein n=1 Tax=Pontibacter sp. E15-1 TaxID=2919918 RepID=UPI001F4F6EF6|nr:Gfo/Idh/MocA family oxidoreductase [Pontibacter sp. E15-1]MCJ8167067.1 Gfo/Idh/MocA family oxidoreductase [Pontibacter sp. E15-1]
MHQKLRLGMIGGGQGAFIGGVHRIAAQLDNAYELVCGAFSSNAEKSKASGEMLGIAPERVYASYKELFEKEQQLPEAQRVQVISIVTPNHVHFEPAKMALESGFHVILDKPMTFSLEEALQLRDVQERSGMLFCLTHTYTGYPMVKEARQLVASGKLGQIRKVYVEYPQGWLSTFEEGGENKQASWRTDPKQSGIAGAMGDIGTHAFNLAEYVSGLAVTKINADINVVVDGRQLDDDGAALLKFDNGASGVLVATQVAAGEENNVRIRVYGEKGGLEWQQEDANTLQVKWLDRPNEIYRTGGGNYLSSYAQHNTRTPGGHPEGYLEAFANLYRNFALCVQARLKGEEPQPEWQDYPGIEDGVRGMAFIENVIASGQSNQKWTDFTI